MLPAPMRSCAQLAHSIRGPQSLGMLFRFVRRGSMAGREPAAPVRRIGCPETDAQVALTKGLWLPFRPQGKDNLALINDYFMRACLMHRSVPLEHACRCESAE